MTTDQRVERLERQLGQLKVLATALGALLVVLVIYLGLLGLEDRTGAAAQGRSEIQQEVRASSFVLEDAQGRERARLALGLGSVVDGRPDGAGLFLYHESGRPHVQLGIKWDGSFLSLSDDSGNEGATLYVSRRGSTVALLGENFTRAAVEVMAGSGPQVVMESRDGNEIWRAP